MRPFLTIRIAAAAILVAGAAGAQAPDSVKQPRATAFFDSEDPVSVTLSINLRQIRGDKEDKAPWRSASLILDGQGKSIQIPIRARTRGIWRLKNCEFPPLRLDLPGKLVTGTIFEGINKPKLVSFCRNSDTFEQYVLQELQLYRAYSLLTPMGHKARLLRVTYADSASGKVMATRYAILLEEPEEMAARLDGMMIEAQGAQMHDLDTATAVLAGVFQYFIANTDFSVAWLHNYELVARPNGQIIPVPYDFDFAGAINAEYATVDPSLSVRRVRDRLFRGYCASPEEYDKAFDLFTQKKEAIYNLYNDDIGKLMSRRIAAETLKFYDDFYKIIGDRKLAKRNILDACRK